MSIRTRSAFVLMSLAVCGSLALGQQSTPSAQPGPHRIHLDVVVTPKSGAPVGGLEKGDFTILDNKALQPIASFAARTMQSGPVEVVIVMDAVNTDISNLSFERDQVDKFLRADGGHLAYPTSLAIFTDTGTEVMQGSTRDGNALSAALDQSAVGHREINRSAGFWGADERLGLSLNGLNQLATRESTQPGRKIILWISPGWPYLSGPREDLDNAQRQQLFAQVTSMSTQLRLAGITLYSVDPLGAGENVGAEYYYEEFVRGVAKPDQVEAGDLALQVLAVQSGGLAVNAGNDIASHLQQCIADLGPYYEISFVAPPAERANEYHAIEVKVDKRDLTAHTRTGYYAQP